ncbi:MAG: YgjV family protein [Defluviitaleaceae bacterium]|nr:YgjV family protein [Defluviitaleaceae bacterium]
MVNSQTWFIVAQVLGLITIIFEFASYQIKDKAKYFLTTGVGSFFWMFMFVAIGLATGMSTQLSLLLAATYSTIRNLVFYRIFSKNTPQSKEAGLIFLLVMIAIAVVAGTITVLNAPEQVRWLHILGLFAALAFVIGQYLPGDHYVRVTVVFYAVVVLLTQTPLNILEGDFRWNIMGILIETAKIISVIIFYARYSSQPKKPQLTFVKP